MSYTWIKLYAELLEDPKIGRLPNHLWRRFVELLLLAGKAGMAGQLQPVEEMAWALRSSDDEVRGSLMSLAEIGVVRRTAESPETWEVTNFAKRQAAMSEADRQRKHRAGITPPSQPCHESVTEGEGEGEGEGDSKTPPPTAPPKTSTAGLEGYQAVAERIYQQVTGQFAMPATEKRPDAQRVLSICAQHATETEVVEALKPYWTAWIGRNYARTNLSWIADWFVAGEIPVDARNKARPERPGKPGGRAVIDDLQRWLNAEGATNG